MSMAIGEMSGKTQLMKERIYTADHSGVVEWTRIFITASREKMIFERFEAGSPKSRARARIVGPLWHRFSALMPWLLCQAAAKVSSNEMRHYIVQGAYEELGMRDVSEIHPDMFKETAAGAGAMDIADRVLADQAGQAAIEALRDTLLAYRTDDEVLGLLLGLEIPAVENIEAVFDSLAHAAELEQPLAAGKFFRIHRQIEAEHIRRAVSNFLRFCTTDDQKRRFQRGFQDGLTFWERFWGTAAVLIAAERRADQA